VQGGKLPVKGSSIRPVIVVGINRSGTKWLSNILCKSRDITGMQRNRTNSGGMMETNMFGNLQRVFRSLRRPDDFVGLVQLWSTTDFFGETGLDKEFLFSITPRPTDCLELFRTVMDEVAVRKGCRYWLQKTSPFQASAVLNRYTDAKLVVIRRKMVDTLRSQLGGMRRGGNQGSLLKEIFFNVLQGKNLNRIERRHSPSCSVTYEALAEDKGKETRLLCGFLGIEYSEDMLETDFAPNTSFQSTEQRSMALSGYEEKVILFAGSMMKLIPRWLLSCVHGIFRRGNQGLFVPGSFGNTRDRFDIR
jgi:hypothetical protein